MWGKIRRKTELMKAGRHYKWVALSNTTLGVLMATISGSIVMISLPAIFRGIDLDPLRPSNINYLLWTLMGYMVCAAVLVVAFGRLGDIFGRSRMYTLGFWIFTLASVALSLTPGTGREAALFIIITRIVQGIGGALLFANSTAILTDAFPVSQRGLALGINTVAAIGGSFIGLIVGGLLADINWRLIFWVSVPFGLVGSVWANIALRDLEKAKRVSIDWIGNVTFAVGLVLVLIGINYGVQPYGGDLMGWTSPRVLGLVGVGVLLLLIFVWVELRRNEPMFDLRLFKVRAFSMANLASFLSAIGRGGLQFMLIIWLQGIWLPLHGYSFEQTPLMAGIFMLPLTAGFLIAGPLAGYLSDKSGGRMYTTVGMAVGALSFILLMTLPADFPYWAFAVFIFFNGVGSGMFASPNSADIMNSVPSRERGQASGMRATTMNAGNVLSIGIFFSLMIVGLANSLPATMASQLESEGVSSAVAEKIAHQPPVASLFAAFLGYNPMEKLVPTDVMDTLPTERQHEITSKQFFPHLISKPFMSGLTIAFSFSAALFAAAAIASWFRGKRYIYKEDDITIRDKANAIDGVVGA